MQELATYIASARTRDLPEPVTEKTKHHVLDTIAAMVSGSALLPGRKAISYIATRGGTAEACVVASPITTSVENAALANGMLAHADETDDSHTPTSQHPGCGIISAALAMAEREGRGGTELLRAVALGYDVSCRMNRALHAYQFRVVGHSTHSFGPSFGAASAAGSLAALNEDQSRHLLSYAAQQTSGVCSWQRDTEHVEKAFDFGGMPARNGVTAASMVSHGFSAVDDVFAGDRNFFVAYDESARTGLKPEPEQLVRELGRTYEIMNTSIKRWAVGMPIQAPLDCLTELMRAGKIDVDEIERIEIGVGENDAFTVNDRAMPTICMQHICAVMLLDGALTFASAHDEARMSDERVLALRGRIVLIGDEALTRVMPERHGIVEISLRDGRTLRHHTRAVRGTPGNPMTRTEAEEKCLDLMGPVLGDGRSRALCDFVWNLEKVDDIRAIRELVRAT
jgi:2-methylcitrate dehydratase PrpD